MLIARRAAPTDLPRVLELVTGMFADLGTTAATTEWKTGARDRLLSGDMVAAFVTVEPDDPTA